MSAPIDLHAARLRSDRRRAGFVSAPPFSFDGAHFRSRWSSSALERERALTFAELAVAVFDAVEQQVNLPTPALPRLDVPAECTVSDAVRLAQQARQQMGLPSGPVPHMVRLLEAHGIAVVRPDREDLCRVGSFSHAGGSTHPWRTAPARRPIVVLDPAGQDKARSRFDAAHELGHLLMHRAIPGTPGSRLIEQQAEVFAAEFLTPAAEIAGALPPRLDWIALHGLKRRWGVSLKALVVRAHTLGRLSDAGYQRGMRQLAVWGLPERGELGPLEAPVLLPRALDLLGGPDPVAELALEAGLPAATVQQIVRAAGGDAVTGVDGAARAVGADGGRSAMLVALPRQA